MNRRHDTFHLLFDGSAGSGRDLGKTDNKNINYYCKNPDSNGAGKPIRAPSLGYVCKAVASSHLSQSKEVQVSHQYIVALASKPSRNQTQLLLEQTCSQQLRQYT